MGLSHGLTALAGLQARVAGWFKPPRSNFGIPGLYHFNQQDGYQQSRIHLRIDPDGRGILLINANRILHLNPSAALMAHLTLAKLPITQAISIITQVYRTTKKQAAADYAQFCADLAQLIIPDGACPVHDLGIDTLPPFSARPSAPYRMDLALTYRCNNNCPHCYNDRPRSFAEMDTPHWKLILDRLWEIGIPHIVFTGGEPTLRDDLPELIAHAQKNGQITGLNTNACRLANRKFVQHLVEAGLDHVQITLESHDAAIHDRMVKQRGAWQQTVAGLKNALDTPLFVMTNTTMLQENAPALGCTLDFLGHLGVPTIGLNALIYSGHGLTVGTGLPESALPPLLDLARAKTDQFGQKLIWYTPTQYCHFDPVQMDLGVKGCTAALYNMCIEPDGAVLPCQSYYKPMGNLLTDPWQTIWTHPLALSLRERHNLPAKCLGCGLLPECGGGCPLKFDFINP
jgi:radical SAM protein with 4Fe4S-binding SPASM domain